MLKKREQTAYIKNLIYEIIYKKLRFGYIIKYSNMLFFPIIRKQKEDYRKIPIIINNFNQLRYLTKLVDFLLDRRFENIVIVDNASTYPPLLDYYESIRKKVTIERLDKNLGHKAIFKDKKLLRRYCNGYYILTDSDCMPSENTPIDFVKVMMEYLDKYYLSITKVGLALDINNIPEHYGAKQKVINWEKQFWQNKLETDVYQAIVDTTFALYKPRYGNYILRSPFLLGLRVAGKYTMTHGGWCDDTENPCDELRFYQKTANSSFSWNIDQNGSVVSKMY